jgi:hypothetical protein
LYRRIIQKLLLSYALVITAFSISKKKDVALTTSLSIIDMLSGEPIPGRLLLGSACFLFGSTLQNSNRQTIFRTCRNSQALSARLL